jgi:ribose transport system permease protein
MFFGIARPQEFLTRVTLTSILSNEAVIGILCIAAVIPLLAGLVDLSVGAVAGFGLVFSAWLSTTTQLNDLVICAVTLLACSCFGILSGALVTRFGINSIVTTLGVSTVALGLSEAFAGGNTITPLFDQTMFKFGQSSVSVVPLPFLYFIALAIAAYTVIERMPVGRRLQAIGSNPVASQLAGIRVQRIRFGALIPAALLSGFAGLVLVAQVGTASSSTGSGLLLPVLSTVFLGATQIKNRPNIAGIAVALLVLGTGIKGMELMGAQPWVSDFFYGCMLLIAVALASGDVGRLE